MKSSRHSFKEALVSFLKLILTVYLILLFGACDRDSGDDTPKVPPPVANGELETIPSLGSDSHLKEVPQLVANNSGDLMAIWRSDSGTGYQLRAAFKSSSDGTWRDSEILFAFPATVDNSTIPTRKSFFASDGTIFLVAWFENGQYVSKTFDPKLAAWSSAAPIPYASDHLADLQLVGESNRILALWSNGLTVSTSIYQNGAWSAQPSAVLDSSRLGTANYINVAKTELFSADDGHYFVASSLFNADTNQAILFLQVASDSTLSSWSDPILLNDVIANGNIYSIKLLALTPNQYVVAWVQPASASVLVGYYAATVGLTNGNLQIVSAAEQINTTGQGTSREIAMVKNSNAMAVAWIAYSDFGGYQTWINIKPIGTDTTWSGAQLLSGLSQYETSAQLCALDNRFVTMNSTTEVVAFDSTLAWSVDNLTTSTLTDFQSIIYSANLICRDNQVTALWRERTSDDGTESLFSSTSTNGLDWPLPKLLDQSSDMLADLFYSLYFDSTYFSSVETNSQLQVTWRRAVEDDAGIHTRILSVNADSGTPVALDFHYPDPSSSSAVAPVIASNNKGEILAVWGQSQVNQYYLTAAFRDREGHWSKPEILSSFPMYNDYNGYSLLPGDHEVFVLNNGFIVRYTSDYGSQFFQYDGKNWLQYSDVNQAGNLFITNNVAKTTISGSSLITAWRNSQATTATTGVTQVYLYEASTPTSGSSQVVYEHPIDSSYSFYAIEACFAVASNKNDELLVTWVDGDPTQGYQLMAGVRSKGSWKFDLVTDIGNNYCNFINPDRQIQAIASDNGDFLIAATDQTSSIISAHYTASTGVWGHPDSLTGSSFTFAAIDNELVIGYLNGQYVVVSSLVNGNWKEKTRTLSLSPLGKNIDLVANNNRMLAMISPTSSQPHYFSLLSYQAGQWHDVALDQSMNVQSNIAAVSPSLTTFDSTFAIAWSQVDPDTATSGIGALVGGF